MANNDLPPSAGEDPFAQALALASPRPGERVLDLSGRAGLIALKVASVAAVVEAMQPDDELAEEGRRLARTVGTPNVFFRAGPIHRLPFDSGQFDLVIWCLGLAQQPRPLGTMAEIARVLNPGGRLVLQEIMAFGHPPLDLKIWELERRRNPGHLLYYTEEEIEGMLSLAKLQVAKKSQSGMTQDFAYWAEGGDVTPEEAGQMRQTFFTLPPADQDRIDLALSDGRISFVYPVLTVLAVPA